MQTCNKIICASLVSATVLVACSVNSMADVKIAKIGDTVVDTNALTIKGHFGQAINGTSFQQEAIVTHGAHQYVGYAFLIYSTRTKLYSTRGNLVIASATAASKWTDWKIVHEEEGPFVNEMLGDPCRWKKDGILSVLVQESPETHHEATPLRILDFTLEQQ
jgi:hypothetical protein